MKTDTLPSTATPTSTPTLNVNPRTTLNLQDRCDGCGAQAFIAVEMKSGTELLFCNHHYRKSEAGIASLAAHILDESAKINAKPTAPEDNEF